MKKLLLAVALVLGLSLIAQAEMTVKQGFLYGFKDREIKNLTTLEVIKTKQIEGLGNWNILIDGWTLDVGFAYTGESLNTGALLLGRELGTLGKYIPIDFPLKDSIIITIYPIGLRADDLFANPDFQGCSGGAFIKMTLEF